MASYTKHSCLLKAENISLTLGENQILKDVNVEIHDIVRPNVTTGQVVGFLGPSGIGKTMFFEILAGLRQPTTGTVQVGDPLKPVEAGMVGVIQQSYPLFQHRTVWSNLEVAAKRRYTNESERKDRIVNMLERFKMRDKAMLYPAQLSGGQKQRMAIAQQLLCSEHFLLMDEPFSGLDINMIDEVSETISEIACAHEHNTVIIVSHDIVSTVAIADTIWLMGRDRDTNGNIIPGAHIKHTYDLLEMGLAYDKNIRDKRDFQDLLTKIRAIFHTL